ncbi:hypothetical protein [Vibrio parahaemolyticus]|uniref:hypothetical protein n=1 Tax=Vibrio parahaemolyticus TaxID=670 RepID=UPI00387AA3D3
MSNVLFMRLRHLLGLTCLFLIVACQPYMSQHQELQMLSNLPHNFGPVPTNIDQKIEDYFKSTLHHPDKFAMFRSDPMRFYLFNADSIQWQGWIVDVAVAQKAIYLHFSEDSNDYEPRFVFFENDKIVNVSSDLHEYVYDKKYHSYVVNNADEVLQAKNYGIIHNDEWLYQGVRNLPSAKRAESENTSVSKSTKLPSVPKQKTTPTTKKDTVTPKKEPTIISSIEEPTDDLLQTAITEWKSQRSAYLRNQKQEHDQLSSRWARKCDSISENFFRSAKDKGPGTHVCYECSSCEADWNRAMEQFESQKYYDLRRWDKQNPKPSAASLAKQEKSSPSGSPKAVSDNNIQTGTGSYIWHETSGKAGRYPLYNELHLYPEGYSLRLYWRKNTISGEAENGTIQLGAWKQKEKQLIVQEKIDRFGQPPLISQMSFAVGSNHLKLKESLLFDKKSSRLEAKPIEKLHWNANTPIGPDLFRKYYNGPYVGDATKRLMEIETYREYVRKNGVPSWIQVPSN